jgi:DNA-binding MurR/RpiR family transcriptional regulator
MSFRPPETYEDLIRLIHDRHDAMSRSYQRIALCLTQNPNDVAVLSVSAIGAKCGIRASSLVRYAQSLGYKGFRELQAVFRRRLTTAARGVPVLTITDSTLSPYATLAARLQADGAAPRIPVVTGP